MGATEGVCVQFRLGDGRLLRGSVPEGYTLLDAARSVGLTLAFGECGGFLTCATCRVRPAPGWDARLPAAAPDEAMLLGALPDTDLTRDRCACQIALSSDLDGLEVEIPGG